MIELRHFEPADFDQLISWVPTPEFLLQWGGPEFRFPLDNEQLERYIAGANRDGAERLIYKVVHTETQKVIGHISLGKIDREHRSARIGKVLVGEPAMRGQGIGEQMVIRSEH
ncbi:GNAT family N-acetyltransferase [Caldalkalibacillus thermarum TA2.A1]|nr:GNAT family N-acetyltransferase [Caldalkalibacillus thermarum]QZT35321.1 GNAT family N-acetyltransferase [Caldalkalibacillus thermarum TA2.A1]GGK17912.1 hypothetical protein GCM10010965_08640 [Caldalkalibacillus thermarum]